MIQRFKTSTWIVIATIAVLLLILMVISPNVLQTVLAVPLVLFVPGFALTLILFPRKSIGIVERLLLSVGLSVSFTALSGLALNLTPWGLQANTLWIALLITLAVEVAILFFARRSWWIESAAVPSHSNFNTRQWVLLALAALITVMAIRVAALPTPQQGLQGYTMLWVKPADTPNKMHIGVQSEEFAAAWYQVKYEFDGGVHLGSAFQLKPGETWERIVPIPAAVLSSQSSITVLLYRLDSPDQVYRRVIWWPNSH